MQIGAQMKGASKEKVAQAVALALAGELKKLEAARNKSKPPSSSSSQPPVTEPLANAKLISQLEHTGKRKADEISS